MKNSTLNKKITTISILINSINNLRNILENIESSNTRLEVVNNYDKKFDWSNEFTEIVNSYYPKIISDAKIKLKELEENLESLIK